MAKPTLAVHKFSSCDGCQLALLNMGPDLLALAEQLEIKHFAEAGIVNESAPVDIALVEGSVVTAADETRIREVRANSRYLISMGACATSGGIQALKNLAEDPSAWVGQLYPQTEFIDSLDRSHALKAYVRVDFELWGCPVNSRQVVAAAGQLLQGVSPVDNREKLCLECKRAGQVCTLVTRGEPCMGPVTRAGCGALCPAFGRACYGCYGEAELSNGDALQRRLEGLGLAPERAAARFRLIHPDQQQQDPLQLSGGDHDPA
ncbi:sulfhydrogenase subunit delta [Neptuniibacter halophilus]|uniref:NADH-quinone oxidoreductase subunit B family protein n=1 Tax=Neptuniibacter halophilus TaxID=651666 RepID=UPI002573716C|nr:sulfhydrogenase subunit delta [Neptuniibacter halophilus]